MRDFAAALTAAKSNFKFMLNLTRSRHDVWKLKHGFAAFYRDYRRAF